MHPITTGNLAIDRRGRRKKGEEVEKLSPSQKIENHQVWKFDSIEDAITAADLRVKAGKFERILVCELVSIIKRVSMVEDIQE